MYIASVTFPGMALELSPDESRSHVQALFRNMTSALAEAAVSLGWFEADRSTSEDGRAAWDLSQAIREEARRAIRGDASDDLRLPASDRERVEIEALALEIARSRGIHPPEYRSLVVFLHARTFLYALDAVARSLGAIAKTPGVPRDVEDIAAAWAAACPTVQAIRDSSHHMEDRARGLDRNRRPLQLKPIVTPYISASGGALILNSLTDNRYGTTTAAGDFEEVDVTPASLEMARSLVQRAIDAFSWTGPAIRVPTL